MHCLRCKQKGKGYTAFENISLKIVILQVSNILKGKSLGGLHINPVFISIQSFIQNNMYLLSTKKKQNKLYLKKDTFFSTGI